MSKKIEIASVILCEDIRQEKTNKYILIGVYSNGILVEGLPTFIPLSLYVETKGAPTSGDFYIKFSGPGEGSAEACYSFTNDIKAEMMTIVTPRFDIQMDKEGIFKVEWCLDGKNWRPLLERRVQIKSDLWKIATIASPPLGAQSPFVVQGR